MNSITGILSREYLNKTDRLNIIWTPVDHIMFEQTIQKLGHNLLSFDHLYFGKDSPHIIICNNKMIYHQKCKNISIQFHIPVLMIDHNNKPANVEKSNEYELPCMHKIALSETVANSWQEPYHKILEPEQISDTEFWSQMIFKTSKMLFKYYE